MELNKGKQNSVKDSRGENRTGSKYSTKEGCEKVPNTGHKSASGDGVPGVWSTVTEVREAVHFLKVLR
jgi:hypothetical protein